MRRTKPSLTTIALTLLVACGVALAVGVGSAGAQSSVVGPGESIQKAVNAADPGDTIVVGQKAANAKVVGNNISGGAWGIYVGNTKGGSIAGNTIHDNCAGMFFEAFKAEPVGGFEVKGNTVEDNTRSCRAGEFEINVSGVGIALLGASGMEVTGNQISGNVPSGPTRVSGGVVVSKNPYFGGSAKPRNNSVTGNHFGHNKPDIFWDKSGTGNVLRPNNCNTSVPSSLCN